MISRDGQWTAVDRPGYFGKHREARYAQFDLAYGLDGWRLAWEWAGQYLELAEAVMLYEDAYMQFLRGDVLEELIGFLDVYDDAPSNVRSGTDYSKQETERTHLQDIAIRRSLLRLGTWFRGRELLQIRDWKGSHQLSMTLSPGRVPFHRPDLIKRPELTGWWQSGSVESFYQSNKTLLVRIT